MATATADLTAADAEVVLTPQESARVSGQVTLQNADPRLLSRMFISLRSEDFRTPSFSREIAPDGTFQIPVSWPGRFRLWITGVPGVFASRVTSEDSAFQNGVLTIGDGTLVKLNVVASGGMGRVSGFVRRNDSPASGVLVVLASAALPADPGWYLGFKTDSDGSFDFKMCVRGLPAVCRQQHRTGICQSRRHPALSRSGQTSPCRDERRSRRGSGTALIRASMRRRTRPHATGRDSIGVARARSKE